eukprot:CAMPEP_0171100204 /NCGR_PEP_ID=MMETSP0766_2-20121228/52820_1 /TAXON_ID=439317 /ORGANISM="Gambierdiscus australes, Strain CAWD 149" /LENGTH=110 /DNA_ID=CAMNT_0011559987 /DNA_START=174 /DNA_END=505 /DNA_ORIENTATION=+
MTSLPASTAHVLFDRRKKTATAANQLRANEHAPNAACALRAFNRRHAKRGSSCALTAHERPTLGPVTSCRSVQAEPEGGEKALAYNEIAGVLLMRACAHAASTRLVPQPR